MKKRYVFDKIWFQEYQKGLIWFANSWIGRMVFRYGKMGLYQGKHHLEKGVPIIAISPNSVSQYVWFRNKIQIRQHFFIRNEYAIKLRFWLYPLWYVLHLWDLFADRLMPQLSFGFSTFTINPNAGDPGTTTFDGQVSLDIAENTYATLHDATDGTSKDATETIVRACRCDAGPTTNKWATMIRSFFLVDITALAAGVTIDSSVWSTFGNTVTDNLGSQALSLVASTPASNTTPALADYDQLGTVVQATNIAFSALSAIAYNDMTLNAAGDTTVSTAYSGAKIVKFGHRLESDRANSAPTWGANLMSEYKCNTADHTSNKPKLVITYHTAYSLVLAQGAYTLTGQALTMLKALKILLVQGAYTLTGQVVVFSKGFGMACAQGAYTLTGQAITFTRLIIITCVQGAYTLTGQTITVGRGIKIVCVTGYYTLTGFAIFLLGWIKRVKPSIGTWTARTKPSIGDWTKRTKPQA